MLVIAKTYLKEILHKKLLHLLLGLTIVYLILFYIVIYFTFNDMQKNVDNPVLIANNINSFVSIFGFYFSTMLLSFVSIMMSANIISGEIENSIINSIITRPLKRSSYISGKFFGLGTILVCYSLFLYYSVIIIIYTLDIPVFSDYSFFHLLKGSLFYALIPAGILSLSIFISSKFKTLITGIILFSIYILGLIGSILEQIGTVLEKDILIQIGILASLISPFETIYKIVINTLFANKNMINSIFGGGFLSSIQPSKWMILYIIIYIIALPLLGVLSFQKKDL